MRFDLRQQGWALGAVAPFVSITDRTVVGPVEQVLNVLVTCCCVGNSKHM
uniref:Uncharacterized protein n=1 Tax=Arundo donax TaxID=35708 RepID=A0A0A9GPK0_ARUDO